MSEIWIDTGAGELEIWKVDNREVGLILRMQNYFHYFAEIEERFSRRRGSVLLLSTLDWALIENWREAGVPLEAVIRGIDIAFDRYEARSAHAKGRLRKVNGLAWCAQAVMESAEQTVEATTGAPVQRSSDSIQSGFDGERVATYLIRNSEAVAAAGESLRGSTAEEPLSRIARRLHELAVSMHGEEPMPLEELDRTLTVLEGQVVDALRGAESEAELVKFRERADRELAPYRSRLGAIQLRQVQQQFLAKGLLEKHSVPRLSLFYMGVGE
jgi:hypothetical protein